MKKIIVLIAAALIMFVACSKNNDNVNVEGSWHLTESSVLSNEVVDIWVSFSENKTFKLYQKSSDEDRYASYDGTYSVNGNKLTGKYSDGTSWGGIYSAELSENGNTLTLTAGKEISTYTKTEIPSSVSSSTYTTKAGHGKAGRWL